MAIGATKLNFEDGQGARNITPPSTAPVFSSSTSYVVGDLVFYDDDLYKCTTAHSGVWNASHFTAVTVSGELQAKEAEIADVKSDLNVQVPIQYIYDHYVDLHVEPVNIANPPESTNPGEKCAIVSCTEGDVFIINAIGGGWGRAWGFLDNDNMIISKADAQATVENLKLTAPANAVKLIINDHGGLLSYQDRGFVTGVVADLASKANNGLTDSAKEALLACFRNVAWINDQGQTYYNALEEALSDKSERTLLSITAVFNQGMNVIYTDDSLDTLKQYLTVTAHYDDSTNPVVTAYTLSGNLADGTNTITVSYGGKTTTFTATAVDFYNIWEWSMSDGSLQKVEAGVDPNRTDSPSRTLINFAQASKRRTYPVARGRVPHYNADSKDTPTAYYPVPVPKNANHVKITMTPNAQYIYMHTVPYDPANNYYLNSIVANRIAWTQLTTGYIEKTLVGYEDMQLFIILNSKYDSAGADYPVEPTNMTITFSRVELQSISADFNAQGATIYTDDSLDTLKQYLTVTAHYDDSTTAVVTGYTLSGSLSEGTNTISVTYESKTTTFNVIAESPLLYQTKNRTLNKSVPCIDTGVALLSTDRTYTIFLDITQDTADNVGTPTRIMQCTAESTNWKGIYFGNNATDADAGYVIQWMATNVMVGDSFKKATVGARCRVVYVHTKGTNTCDVYWKVNNETLNHETITAELLYPESNLVLGNSDQNKNFIGIYNELTIYKKALSSEQINALMA